MHDTRHALGEPERLIPAVAPDKGCDEGIEQDNTSLRNGRFVVGQIQCK